MQLLNHRFENQEKLEQFINRNIPSDKHLFLQVFSGIIDKKLIQSVLDVLHTRLPGEPLIGATTAGEIMDGSMSSGEIIIAFSLFDATEIKTYYYPVSDYTCGEQAAREVVTERTKVCIVLSEGLKSDSESFLNGFTSVRNDIVLAGGNAGDDLTFTRTFIMKENTVYDEGVVVAVLDSDVLEVHNDYSLYWTTIGKEMTVTKADKNIIYEIDNKPVKSVYTHYLGAEAVGQIPASAIEFPLIKINDGVKIARSIIAQTPDEAFVYAGHFYDGDKVRFSIGNVEEILDYAVDFQESVSSHAVEATYIYSCSVRKLFLQDQLNYELNLINDIAPTCGLFTYGEFFHSPSGNQLLNITTTALSLSESPAPSEKRAVEPHQYRHSMLKSLTHLVNEAQLELDDNIKILDQYKMVLDESSIVSKTDAQGHITYVNDAFCKVSGYSRTELIGQNHNIVRHPETPAELFHDLWETIKSGKIWKETFRNLSKSGEEYYVKSVIAPIFDDKGDVVEFIAARVDVTELIKQEKIIQRQLTDSLSGLKNRTALFSDLETGDEDKILLLLNIDRFSNINDYYGYTIGDGLLRAFADFLKETVANYSLYRISGDEFAIIYSGHALDDKLRDHVIDHITRLENNRYEVEGNTLLISLSGGIAYAKYSEVYNLAHMALKEAKERQSKVVFFNDNVELSEKTRNNIWLISKIKSAIEEDRIVPYFQGIVDNETRQIVKYESLIRLIETDGTVLSPFWFLEHAKKAKLYDQLTRIMIAKTFAVFEVLDTYEFSLNLTLQDILSDETRMFLYDTLHSSRATKRLVLEIVESEGIESFDEVTEFIRTVKGYGCKIAIDDFGTGYSNFNYLSKLSVDYIKIDGSLVKNINDDENHLLTVESILFFAQRKGIRTIAEFVENEEIYERLKALGVDYSQGYLFSIPSSKPEC
ncbi:EAL domain-containing protein [uncultured Sulfuricurvum sp.]|uniref:bifunctional diguanylate cyclase/phosphodiesterase n=1 Tax=uncultured Sulfuricurvum sp. TaxID=430693 RepID=UPI002623BDE4|nr:EAL domain-containing protein [uncultured Sulfuricurvum sp.]